jgi:molybdenum transport protein
VFARLKISSPERRLAAETESIDEAIMLALAGAEIIQVDKMAPEQVARVHAELSEMSPRPLLAAAGGVNASNAAAYAAAGANVLVTSAPYHARPRDVKARITKA